MKKKLHIFGCSHSFAEDEKNYWTTILSKKINFELFERTGQPGRNVEYILFDIFDRILGNHIQKEDFVILNTSYPLRFGTPRLQKYSKHPLDINYYEILGLDKLDYTNYDDLNPNITFLIWYIQTFGAWKLLNSVCDNVYQWCLHDVNEMDLMYLNSLKEFSNPENDCVLGLGIIDFPYKFDNNLNPWNNLIQPPKKYKSWDSYIKNNSVAKNDLHLHPFYMEEFSELLLTGINLLK